MPFADEQTQVAGQRVQPFNPITASSENAQFVVESLNKSTVGTSMEVIDNRVEMIA